jgi:hypothetical protein
VSALEVQAAGLADAFTEITTASDRDSSQTLEAA